MIDLDAIASGATLPVDPGKRPRFAVCACGTGFKRDHARRRVYCGPTCRARASRAYAALIARECALADELARVRREMKATANGAYPAR